MTRRCEGKVAIVTGAEQPIAAAVADRLADEGAIVVAAHPGGPGPGAAADPRPLVERTVDAHGNVDIVVNDPGPIGVAAFDSLTEAEFMRLVDEQLWGPYQLVQAVVPHMKTKRSGWILHITDRHAAHPLTGPAAPVPGPDIVVKGMLAAALNRVSTAMAAELYDYGIAVNCLTPLEGEESGAGLDRLTDAAVALCTGPPASLTGRLAYAEPLLAELGTERP